jgi:hypothetical protein
MGYPLEQRQPIITNYIGQTIITYVCSASTVRHYIGTLSTYSGNITFKTILNYPNVQKREVLFEKYKPLEYSSTIISHGYRQVPLYTTIMNYSKSNNNNGYITITGGYSNLTSKCQSILKEANKNKVSNYAF